MLIHEDEVEFEETDANSLERTLRIPIPAGTEEIEIVGTHVIPEFSSAIIIASLAIGVMIVLPRLKNLSLIKNS